MIFCEAARMCGDNNETESAWTNIFSFFSLLFVLCHSLYVKHTKTNERTHSGTELFRFQPSKEMFLVLDFLFALSVLLQRSSLFSLHFLIRVIWRHPRNFLLLIGFGI